MRIHTDKLTSLDVGQAAALAGVQFRATLKGSRSRRHAIDITLSGTSSRHRQQKRAGDDLPPKAATWDEWGIVLAELFRRDPGAMVPKVYESAEHFRWVTGARFDTLTAADQHGKRSHKWSGRYPNITGVYTVAECTANDCTATVRFMESGHEFSEISGRSFRELEGDE